jgi:hypothetical protein
MPRHSRRKPLVPHRSNLSLERLEARDMPSASPIAPPPSAQPAGLVVVPAAATPTVSAVYTPQQIRTAYGVNLLPNQGQGTTVAIVDAFNDPNINSDLSIFSNDFGLPQMNGVGSNPTFKIMTPTGQSTPANAPHNDWAVEISLDVEYVHSIAPFANIDLIETQDNSGDHLYGAEVDGQPYSSGVGFAKTLPGVVVVSNSYGSGEFAGETAYDSEFTTPGNNVAFTFSTGDSGAPGGYPAYSPNVVAVGGTSLYTLGARGAYGRESGWSGGGGGVSLYEPTPAYQTNNGVSFGARATPDVSMDADPNTGVLVLDQYDFPGFFVEVGGTSLASPMWAGLIAEGDASRGPGLSLSSVGVNNALYGAYNSPSYGADFHDVTTGNNGFAAGPGYDLVTGIGTPKAPAIVALLGGAAPGAVVNPGPPLTLNGGGTSGASAAFAPVSSSAAMEQAIFSATRQHAPSETAPLARTATLVDASLITRGTTLEASHGSLASIMPPSGGGGDGAQDSSAPIETSIVPTAAPVPLDRVLLTALSDGHSAVGLLGTPSWESWLPPAGEFGVTDAVFAGYGPLDMGSISATPLLPPIGDHMAAGADLIGVAGMALFLGGAWTGLTPRREAVAQPGLRIERGKVRPT